MNMQRKIGLMLATLILAVCQLLPFMPGALPVLADADHSQVAETYGAVTPDLVKKYGMVPIYPQDIQEGTYDVPVNSSSAFFKITDCKLTVKDGQMTAVMTLSSQSYLLLYMGTGEEATKAPASDYLKPEIVNGVSVFTVPVKALNQEFYCAAFSRKRKKWYDRFLLIDASTLPEGAVHVDLPDYDRIERGLEALERQENGGRAAESTEDVEKVAETYEAADAVNVDLPDGEYSVEVNMTGGSGRASISSPTLMIVKNGQAYAQLIWSSTYYDYMLVGDQKYLNESEEGGNSTFTIPIALFDGNMPMVADTTAMGDPVEINYNLTFYEATIGDKGLIPQVAAKKVLIFAAIVIIVGGIMNYFVKKKRKGR